MKPTPQERRAHRWSAERRAPIVRTDARLFWTSLLAVHQHLQKSSCRALSSRRRLPCCSNYRLQPAAVDRKFTVVRARALGCSLNQTPRFFKAVTTRYTSFKLTLRCLYQLICLLSSLPAPQRPGRTRQLAFSSPSKFKDSELVITSRR